MKMQTKLKTFILAISLLVLLSSTSSVYANKYEIRDIPRKQIPCINGNCTILLDTVQEFAKYQVYHTFEVSGNLIHNTVRIIYYDMPLFKICRNAVSLEEENPRIFDVYIYKNEEQIAFEPYLDFHGEEKKIANFPCYSAQSNDTIIIDYYTGGKIKPVTEKFLFFNISKSQFLYPFDRYKLTSWNGLDKVYYNRIDKVILPNSFVPIENKSDNICPSAVKLGMFRKHLNVTSNETSETWMANFYILGEWLAFEGGSRGDFITEENKRLIIWPTLSSAPLDDIKKINPWRFNFSEDDWENIHDYRTGCYLTLEYERTQIIKYFFFIALFLISFSSIYFLWFDKDKKSFTNKLYKIFEVAFIVWSFQEGLSSLTPLVRPTIITLFDLTILVPIIFIIPFTITKLVSRK